MAEPSPVRKDETQAIAWPENCKRAALLFDRLSVVNVADARQIPAEVLSNTPSIAHHRTDYGNEVVVHGCPLPPHEAKRAVRGVIDVTYDDEEVDFSSLLAASISVFCAIWARRGHPISMMFPTELAFAAHFPSGNSLVYQAALHNLPEIIEDATPWQQILDFRNDEDALRKYRALRLWLESLKAESVAQAADIIAQKIEDYEWALHKHGMKTAIGGLSSILDSKAIATIAGGAGVAGLMTGPVGSAIAAGAIIVGKVAVWLAERKLEEQEIKRGPGSEIAIICEAKKLAGN